MLLDMLVGKWAEGTAWGERALAINAQFGDLEISVYAFSTLGAAEYQTSREAGLPKLERSLELALAHGLDEHIARAYGNLTANAVVFRDYAVARRYFDAALQYFAARDMDTAGNVLQAWRSRLELEKATGRRLATMRRAWSRLEIAWRRLVAFRRSPCSRDCVHVAAILARRRSSTKLRSSRARPARRNA